MDETAFNKTFTAQYPKEIKYLKQLSKETDKSVRYSLAIRYFTIFFLFAIYLVFAASFYSTFENTCKHHDQLGSNCEQRHWNVLESIYFAVVTLFTVGLNDYVPRKEHSKALTLIFIILGFYLLILLLTEALRVLVWRAENRASVIESRLQRLSKITMKEPVFTGVPKTLETPDPWSLVNFDAWVWVLVALAVLFLGGGFICWNEEWPFLDALYLALACMTSVAYGGEYGGASFPDNESTRIFLCLYIPFCALVLTCCVVTGTEYALTEMLVQAKLWRLHKDLNTKSLRAYYDRGDLRLGRHEYCLAMLLSMRIVSEDDIELWMRRFEEMDAEHKGFILSQQATQSAAIAHMNRRVFQEFELMASTRRSSKDTLLGWMATSAMDCTESEPHKGLQLEGGGAENYYGLESRKGARPAKLDATDDGRTDKVALSVGSKGPSLRSDSGLQIAVGEREGGGMESKASMQSIDRSSQSQSKMKDENLVVESLEDVPVGSSVSSSQNSAAAAPVGVNTDTPFSTPGKTPMVTSPNNPLLMTPVRVVGPTVRHLSNTPARINTIKTPVKSPAGGGGRIVPVNGEGGAGGGSPGLDGLSRIDDVEDVEAGEKTKDSDSVSTATGTSKRVRRSIFRRTPSNRANRYAVTENDSEVAATPDGTPIVRDKTRGGNGALVKGPKLPNFNGGNILFSRTRDVQGYNEAPEAAEGEPSLTGVVRGDAGGWDLRTRTGGEDPGAAANTTVPQPRMPLVVASLLTDNTPVTVQARPASENIDVASTGPSVNSTGGAGNPTNVTAAINTAST